MEVPDEDTPTSADQSMYDSSIFENYSSQHKTKVVLFKVIDQGKGISKEVQNMLFKPFFSGFLNSGKSGHVMGTGTYTFSK